MHYRGYSEGERIIWSGCAAFAIIAMMVVGALATYGIYSIFAH